MFGCWLYWLKHAHEYEATSLLKVFPQQAIRHATETLLRIAEITDDKTMYHARERAIRDRQWDIESAKREGETETIRILQGLLYLPLSAEADLRAMGMDQLEALIDSLQENLRSRQPS
jgi:thymidylate synthase